MKNKSLLILFFLSYLSIVSCGSMAISQSGYPAPVLDKKLPKQSRILVISELNPYLHRASYSRWGAESQQKPII